MLCALMLLERVLLVTLALFAFVRGASAYLRHSALYFVLAMSFSGTPPTTLTTVSVLLFTKQTRRTIECCRRVHVLRDAPLASMNHEPC